MHKNVKVYGLSDIWRSERFQVGALVQALVADMLETLTYEDPNACLA